VRFNHQVVNTATGKEKARAEVGINAVGYQYPEQATVDHESNRPNAAEAQELLPETYLHWS